MKSMFLTVLLLFAAIIGSAQGNGSRTIDTKNNNYTIQTTGNENWKQTALNLIPEAKISTIPATCSEWGLIKIQQANTTTWNYDLVDETRHISLSKGQLNANTDVTASVAAGKYYLILTNADNYTVEKAIQVDGAPQVTAGFSSMNTVAVNERIVFTSTSLNASANVWDFGDGTKATGDQVFHSYEADGVYTVTITAVNGSGCISSASHTITAGRGNVNVATAVDELKENSLAMWSNGSNIVVDFSKMEEVQATVTVYNMIGQQLSFDNVTSSNVFRKDLSNIANGFVIVNVTAGGVVSTRKIFISNTL